MTSTSATPIPPAKTSRVARIALLVLSLLVAAWYLYLSHKQFTAGRFNGDFAALWQSLHNTAAEGVPYSSFNISVHEYAGRTQFSDMANLSAPLDQVHQFGIHSHFYVYPLALLKLVCGSPYLLLVVQALAYGGFVFLLGLHGLRRGVPLLALVPLTLAFALSPFSVGLILNDFHFDAFAGLAIGAFALLWRGGVPGWVPLLVWGVLTAMIKESFVALVFGAGLCVALSGRKNILKGAGLALFGIALFAFLTKWMIPRFSPNNIFMFSGIYGSKLGFTLEQIVLTSLKHPGQFFDQLFSAPNRMYLLQLFVSCSVLAWFAPRTLLLGAGFLFINLMSSNGSMKIPWGQYSAVIICAMHLAAVDGYTPAAGRLERWIGKIGARLVLAGVLLVPFLGYHLWTPLRFQSWVPAYSAEEYTFLRELPRNLKVSSDDRSANFIADRKSLYFFPVKLVEADVVILATTLDKKPWYPSKAVWDDAVKHLDENFVVQHTRENFTVLRRKGAPPLAWPVAPADSAPKPTP